MTMPVYDMTITFILKTIYTVIGPGNDTKPKIMKIVMKIIQNNPGNQQLIPQ